MLCHGIPDDRELENGDIINIDISVYLKGYHGDTSDTFEVGEVDEGGMKLIKTTRLALQKAIAVCKPGSFFVDIAKVIEHIAKQNKFAVCENFVGHGIGKHFHENPDVFHTVHSYRYKDRMMKAGMAFTIEPILLEGSPKNRTLSDGWTVVSCDNMRSSQAEHTLLITDNGCEILT